MFTIDSIKAAHAKVKTGSDFPGYVQDIIKLGVTGYETYVKDGNSFYFGENGYHIESGPKYNSLIVADKSNPEQFQKDLKAHQQGKTNYPVFCLDSAKSGIEKWVIDFSAMTCTYFDKAGNIIVTEIIPAA